MSDFWKMVLERDVVTIVMIGPLSDSDAEVCVHLSVCV